MVLVKGVVLDYTSKELARRWRQMRRRLLGFLSHRFTYGNLDLTGESVAHTVWDARSVLMPIGAMQRPPVGVVEIAPAVDRGDRLSNRRREAAGFQIIFDVASRACARARQKAAIAIAVSYAAGA
ncbi:hypothetical protein [Mesorhizobium sp.]|uniref:hypothetical protein n=1 Tax=Mesorhizobium sp. TaxID=1871066 RepID=UPI0025BA09C1|nr:hypothetical protein [Mesorhizobium sp.]